MLVDVGVVNDPVVDVDNNSAALADIADVLLAETVAIADNVGDVKDVVVTMSHDIVAVTVADVAIFDDINVNDDISVVTANVVGVTAEVFDVSGDADGPSATLSREIAPSS